MTINDQFQASSNPIGFVSGSKTPDTAIDTIRRLGIIGWLAESRSKPLPASAENLLFGASISYYGGKLETYLRYRGIAYQLLPHAEYARHIRAGAGAVQSPVLRLADGRWLSDTTPILEWFDGQREAQEPSIYPEDPVVRFIALLLEDYADEWFWRPAMHYRWSFRNSRDYASNLLVDEHLSGLPLPRLISRWLLARRQIQGFVLRDGVTATTRGHVEKTVATAFDNLNSVLAERPFILGDRPTIADFGFVAPMFHHLGQDPDPAELMRQRAPHVYAWVARMWEAHPSLELGGILTSIDEPLMPLIRDACETHLVQLRANAIAYSKGRTRFDEAIQECFYRDLPVSRYRVWCLEQLRGHWRALDSESQETLRGMLSEPGAAVLYSNDVSVESGYDSEQAAPFNKAINVYGDGVVPRR